MDVKEFGIFMLTTFICFLLCIMAYDLIGCFGLALVSFFLIPAMVTIERLVIDIWEAIEDIIK